MTDSVSNEVAVPFEFEEATYVVVIRGDVHSVRHLKDGVDLGGFLVGPNGQATIVGRFEGRIDAGKLARLAAAFVRCSP